jgi:hypothetical protein
MPSTPTVAQESPIIHFCRDSRFATLLRDGTIALVGILGIVKGVGGVDIDEPVH